MEHIADETDFFEVPDLNITLDWLKKAYPEKALDFKLVDDYFIQGYKLPELKELLGLTEWQIRRSIKETLEFIKTQMTQ